MNVSVKAEALRRVAASESPSSVARALDVKLDTLKKWRKRAKGDAGDSDRAGDAMGTSPSSVGDTEPTNADLRVSLSPGDAGTRHGGSVLHDVPQALDPEGPALAETPDEQLEREFQEAVEPLREIVALARGGDHGEAKSKFETLIADENAVDMLALALRSSETRVFALLVGLRNAAKPGGWKGLVEDFEDLVKRRSKVLGKQMQQRATFIDAGVDEDIVKHSIAATLDRPEIGEVRQQLPYLVSESSVLRVRQDEDGNAKLTEIAAAPIVPVVLLRDINTGLEHVEVHWRTQDGWRTIVRPASTFTTRAGLEGLRDFGFPVAADNASDIAAFFRIMLDKQRRNMRKGNAASRLGWQKLDGELVFVLGDRILRADGSEEALTFLGEDSMARRIRAGGTIDGWRAALRLVERFPRVYVATYFSLCAPLLEVIPSAPNVIAAWTGPNGGGKSTSQMVKAVCWGYPGKANSDGPGAVCSVTDSDKRIMDNVAALWGVGSSLDDLKDAEDQERVGRMIVHLVHAIYNMSSRGRLDRSGKPLPVQSFRTCFDYTDERPFAARAVGHGGAHMRVIEFYGLPFGVKSPEMQQLVEDQLKPLLFEHYGHAGPAMARHLVTNQHRWSEYRERHRLLSMAWAKRIAAAAPVEADGATRFSSAFALLQLTAEIAADELHVPYPANVFAGLVDIAISAALASDLATQAMRVLVAHATYNQSHFHGRIAPTDTHGVGFAPPGGWHGEWRQSDTDIAFNPEILRKVLKNNGFDFTEVRAMWRDREWLLTHQGARKGYEVSRVIAGVSGPALVITARALRECAAAVGAEEHSTVPVQHGGD